MPSSEKRKAFDFLYQMEAYGLRPTTSNGFANAFSYLCAHSYNVKIEDLYTNTVT